MKQWEASFSLVMMASKLSRLASCVKKRETFWICFILNIKEDMLAEKKIKLTICFFPALPCDRYFISHHNIYDKKRVLVGYLVMYDK